MRERGKKGNSDFIRLTGIWKSEGKSLGNGRVTKEILEQILDRMEDENIDSAGVFLLKNEYNEGRRDPYWIISVLPKDNRDEDERPRRSKRRRRDEDEDEEPRRSKRKRRDEDEDEEPRRSKRKRGYDQDEDEDFEPPF